MTIARRALILASAFTVVLSGCASRAPHPAQGAPVQTLTIRWQRLVDASDRTCPRCATTEKEMRRAFEHLKRSLAPAGIVVRLQTDRIDEETFRKAPLESNRIWIGDRPLEEWLGAQTASSPCCGSCGDAECRTVSLGAQTYEAIPAELIVRAGFVAAGALLQSAPATPPLDWSPFPMIPED